MASISGSSTHNNGSVNGASSNPLSRERRAFLRRDIIPQSFLLPGDYDEWRTDVQLNPHNYYISKPVCLSRGRGVHMVRNVADVPKNKAVLIQKYIRNPLLLANKKKFDIRVYVFVTSVDPLKVYIYEDGIVRFATREYNDDAKSLKQKDIHLTNYSINVKKKAFIEPGDEDEECGGTGSKWTLCALKRHLELYHSECKFDEVWGHIKDIVAKTMIAVESNMNSLVQPNVQHRNICFELFGFDIVLDDTFKPWLLEVNTSPALQTPTLLDKRVKFPLVANMLELAGIIPYSKSEFKRRQVEQRRMRLLGMPPNTSSNDHRQTSSHSSSFPQRPQTPSKRVDIRSIDKLSFSSMKTEDLPDVIRESEAELSRCGRFERVYPPVASVSSSSILPDYYDVFFESNRYNNMMLVKYEKFKLMKMKKRMANRNAVNRTALNVHA